MRTDMTTEIDGALSTRNAGSKGWWECARSGNGNMLTDLTEEDGRDYEEVEGLGETVEEMTPAESAAEDRGQLRSFQPFREPLPGEVPPHAPKPGMAWMRRRIRLNTRKPGGMRLCKVRWVQVSPEKYRQLQNDGQIKRGDGNAAMQGVGFLDLSAGNIKWAAIGGVAAIVGLMLLKRKPAVKYISSSPTG